MNNKIKQVVLLKSVSKFNNTLIMYEKKDKRWKRTIKAKAIIGENGIGFIKKEGDKKTPCGIYKFGIAFGIHKDIDSKVQYIQLNDKLYWVDDTNSKYYNKLIDNEKIKKDWNSAEHLIDYPEQYEYSIEIKYNEKQIKNKGSAIFLHCIKGKSTSGCIAVKRKIMIELLKKLQENAIIAIYKV